MENENISQPLDLLMTHLGLSNADLVNASTEQLSFKMVQKGRKGRQLTLNIQEKIWNALLKAKPDLKVRRRELFCYPMDEATVAKINEAISLAAKKKIKYPKFIDLLLEAGILHYTVQVAANQVTFYGAAGHAHIEKGPAISQQAVGPYNVTSICSAIESAQHGAIDYPTFLKQIYQAGVVAYEVNLRQRRIIYKGMSESYREEIPQASVEAPVIIEHKSIVQEPVVEATTEQKPATTKKKASARKKKPGVVRVTRKARAGVKKRLMKKKKQSRKKR